jgi:shikimate kinase
MRIVLVGVCGSGKTALAKGLRRLGYEVRECAQEHSKVPYMWQAMSRPDVLIYLDASEETVYRRGTRHYVSEHVQEQKERLAHARAHCDLYLMTDDLTERQVLNRAVKFLGSHASATKHENHLTGQGG